MAHTLALTKLFDDVVARFAADAAAEVPPGTPVPNVFGWKTPGQRPGLKQRICWVPGDDGEIGEVGAAKQPGRNPRSLGTLEELFTVYVESADLSSASNAENERKQYESARNLFDAWYRAAWLAARQTLTIVSLEWVGEDFERQRGRAIRVVATIEGMLPDATFESAPVDVHANVTTHLEPNDTEGETDTVNPVP